MTPPVSGGVPRTRKEHVSFERQFKRDGYWRRCGFAPTLEKAHEAAMNFAGRQPKGDDFYSLPKRTLKITEVQTIEVVEES